MADLADFVRQLPHKNRKAVSIVLAIVVVLSSGLIAVVPAVTSAQETDVLANGSFEHGFVNIGGCGVVGAQWSCFTNGGAANYGFYEDQWEPVVADGHSSQLIEINTKGLAAGDADRYAGISQTVRVQPHARYTFDMRGMIRTTETDNPDDYRYVVEVGWAPGPNASWKDVNHWTDTGWYTYFPREEPGYMSSFRTSLMPEAEVITLFVRVWKKWGVPNQELDVNLDAISLVGPPANMQMPSMGKQPAPMEPMPAPMAIVPDQPVQPPMWSEHPGTGGIGGKCEETDLVFNGNFEQGFNDTGYGAVGRGWGPFTNGGAANYGFYDEQWEAVISHADMGSYCNSAAGKPNKPADMGGRWVYMPDDKEECTGHGQLIEINTKDKFPADADRYAGIFQRIGGLTPGAVYTLQLRGLLRGTGDEADEYRFSSHWGINSGPDTDWRNVDHWEEMDLGPIYPRTEPGPLASYRATFRAPSSQIVLFIRAQNKWAIPNVELDFNLDDISLTGCGGASGGTGGWMPEQPSQPMPGDPNPQCTYTVQAGDTLGRIASTYGVTVAAISQANGIDNPNVIYVGQRLTIPGCGNSSGMKSEGTQMMPEPMLMPEESVPVSPMPLTIPESKGGVEEEQTAPESKGGPQEDDEAPPQMRGAPMPPVVGESGRWQMIVPATEPASTRTYTVRPGQSLGQIAVENGVDAQALALANEIQNPDLVYVGQVLTIP